MEYCSLRVFQPSLEATMWASAMMCRVNSYNEEKLDFTTTRLLPCPCVRWLADEDRLLLIPPARDGRTCSSGFEHAAVDSIL